MPIYEYECKECSHRLETIQSINDQPLTECPECHRSALVKLISAAGFRLRGSGWYETDFKTGAKRHGTQDTENKGSTDKEKSATKTENGSPKNKPAA